MMRRVIMFAAAASFATAAASAAGAQQRGESASARPLAPRAGRLGRARPGMQQPGRNPEQRALVNQVRQAFNGVVRRQLNLNDDQAAQLQRVEQKYTQQRAQLQRDEKQARLALAAAILDTTGGADQSKVAGYMDQLIAAQHKRADLLDAEQKELAGFLTPLQRAKYQGLKEQLSKRIAQMKQGAGPGGGVPPSER